MIEYKIISSFINRVLDCAVREKIILLQTLHYFITNTIVCFAIDTSTTNDTIIMHWKLAHTRNRDIRTCRGLTIGGIASNIFKKKNKQTNKIKK